MWVGVKANLTTFEKELDSGVTKAAGRAGKKAGDELDKSLGGRIKQLQGKLGGHVGQIAAGLGVGGPLGLAVGGVTTLIDTLSNAGRAASDFAETSSKLTAVFPTQAEAIRKWGAVADKTMGLSTQAALEAAGTFGNFLQAMGQTEPVAADMSKTMVQLAADLGSFNNTPADEVLLALRSGLSGETEPLRRFGVDISDAAVQTELLAKGVDKVGKGYTQAQKIQGRYALIMKQTVTAQNDYARTSSNTAGATKSQAATVDNLTVKFGGLVNQVQNTAVQLAGSGALALSNTIDAVGQAFTNIQDAIDNTRVEIREVGSELARLAEERGLDPAIGEWFAKVSIGAEDAAQALRDQNAALDNTTQASKDNALANRLDYEQQLLGLEADRVAIANDEEMTAANEEAIALLKAKIEVEKQVEATGNETVRGLTVQAEKIRNVNKEFDLLAATIDYAKRAKLTPDQFFAEALDYMAKNVGADLEQAIGAIGEKVNEGTFVPLAKSNADMYAKTFVYATGVALTDGLGALEPVVSGSFKFPNLVQEALDAYRESFRDFEDDVEITRERIQNKRGKGFHWENDVSRRLTTLKEQFRNDLAAIQWMLEHPEEQKLTRIAIVRQIRAMERERDRALDDKNWTAAAAAERKLDSLIGRLHDLDGEEATVTITMKRRGAVLDQLRESRGAPGRPGSFTEEDAIVRHAAGTDYFQGGWSWVGERGRELVNLPRGSQIVSNAKSEAMVAQGRRIDFYVHDPDGGLARAGIRTGQLAAAIAGSADAQSRYEDDF